MPRLLAPEEGVEVTVLEPELVINNSTDPDNDTLSYTFEIYSDQGMGTLLASASDVAEGTDQTSWNVPVSLSDNGWYFWRVRAFDGTSFSIWSYGSFFVNRENDPPGPFGISSPRNDSEVDTQTPTLEVTNSVDVDEDTLTYTFEVYDDREMSALIATSSEIPEGEDGTTSWEVENVLNDNTRYFWRCVATDEHGASTATLLSSFIVNTLNDAPKNPLISSPAIGSEVDVRELDLIINNAFDQDGDVLSYFFELDKTDTFDSAGRQTSGQIAEGMDTTTWHVAGLDDNTRFYWRVKANDGYAESPWALGSFFVNAFNEPPFTPTLKNPGDRAWVSTLTPKLDLQTGVDPDGDDLIYRFEVYSAFDLDQPYAFAEKDDPEWFLSPELNNRTFYFWRAQAEDEHGETSEWMDLSPFFTDKDGLNVPPEASAGDDIDIDPGETVFLDGSASADPDSCPEPMTFSWSFDSVPTESMLIDSDILDADTPTPSFLPDVAGTYVVELKVGDGKDFAFDYVTVNCIGAPGDLDRDEDVDRDDLNILLIHRNQPASACPECDLDGDGVITVLDARKLVLLCTCPRCVCP